jgi:hypothetical protein
MIQYDRTCLHHQQTKESEPIFLNLKYTHFLKMLVIIVSFSVFVLSIAK